MSFTRIDANNISPSGVAAGTYTNPTITINSSGQVTSASSGQLAQGLQGVQGIIGLQGLQGLGGVQGSSGYIGQDGVQGIQGTQGSGVQGIQGTQGSGAGLAVAQYTTYVHTGDGTTTSFSATSGLTVDTVLVVVDGVTQTPTTNYTISGSSVVFAAAPPNGSVIQLRALGGLIGPQGIAGTGGGLTISSITVTDSSYADLDDTAVSVSGGYIKITGTGFASGCQVVVGTVVAASVSFVSSTEVRAQIPAQVAGTYTVYLTNPNGGVAIRVNGVNYSSTPTWTTTSPLPGGVKNTEISLQLAATSNSSVTYSLANGSTLPSGLSLTSGGLLSGTVTSISADTTYNFTVVATDAEAQDTPQAFQITIVIGDPYYELVALHLPGTGTNLANNNTFQDSSSNNFTITRSGNTTQGTFSPFSQTGWGNYFNGSSSLNVALATAISTSNFTFECWLCDTGTISGDVHVIGYNVSGGGLLRVSGTDINWDIYAAGTPLRYSVTRSFNTWYHIAYSKEGSNGRLFYNGNLVATQTDNTNYSATTNFIIGSNPTTGQFYPGYISNARVVIGRAVYTSSFTVPTSPLGITSGGQNPPQGTETKLLTCQSNRFLDSSSSPVAITIRYGSPSVQAFSPFNPTASWSAAAYGGSGYFDGSGDYLTAPGNAAFNFGSGDFTIEAWIYPQGSGTRRFVDYANGTAANSNFSFFMSVLSSNVVNGGVVIGNTVYGINGTTTIANTWTHVALVRSGTGASNLKLYVNGVAEGSASIGSGAINTLTGTPYLSISSYYNGGGEVFNGYVSSARIVKGTAVYTSAFTPPTAPLTAITNTSLLLNFTNAGIYDAAGKNDLETVGNAQISTAISAKWGSGSMYFDGAGDYLNFSSSHLFGLGTGDFTIEFWLYLNTVSGTQNLCDFRNATATEVAITLYMSSASPRLYVNGADRITGGNLSTGQWYHVALTRSSTSTKLFVGGTQSGSTYTDSNNYLTPRPLRIGMTNDGTTQFPLNAYIQDFRVTLGYARYTANFTPPTAAFPTL